jgi:ankyrin repeat protein
MDFAFIVWTAFFMVHVLVGSTPVGVSFLDVVSTDDLVSIEQFITNEANLDIGDALMTVVTRSDNLEIIKLLVERRGANVNQLSHNGETPLLMASRYCKFNIVRSLIDFGALIDHPGLGGETPLMRASSSGCLEIVVLLKERGAEIDRSTLFGRNALMHAVEGGNVNVVQVLIDSGALVNHADIRGVTALMIAAARGYVAIALCLIENGATIDHANMLGRNALMYAAWLGHEESVRLLISYGANVNLADNENKWTALFFAITDHKLEISRALILAGANTAAVYDRLAMDGQAIHEKSIESFTVPVRIVSDAAVSGRPIGDVSFIIQDHGISLIEGFILFAFESFKINIDVFTYPEFSRVLRNHEWEDTKIGSVKAIIHELVSLQCSSISVLYIIAPFLVSSDKGDIRRLEAGLQFLTNSNPEVAWSTIEKASLLDISGPVFNEMIHRASPLGFRPVLKGIYAMYIRAFMEARHRTLRKFKLPHHLISIVASLDMGPLGMYRDFKKKAMVELTRAIKIHFEILK